MKLIEETDTGFVPAGFVPDLASYDIIALNTSGGKDSQATIDYVLELALEASVPRERLIMVHADLHDMDWPRPCRPFAATPGSTACASKWSTAKRMESTRTSYRWSERAANGPAQPPATAPQR